MGLQGPPGEAGHLPRLVTPAPARERRDPRTATDRLTLRVPRQATMPETPWVRALPYLLLLTLLGAVRGHPPSAVDPSEPDVVAAAEWAATSGKFTGFNRALAVLEAQRQLVNGFNFDLVLVLGGEAAGSSVEKPPSLAHARVYKQPPWMPGDEMYSMSESVMANTSYSASSPDAAQQACPSHHLELSAAPKMLLQELDSDHIFMGSPGTGAESSTERHSYLLYTGEGVGGLGIAAETNSTGTFYSCIGEVAEEGAGGPGGEASAPSPEEKEEGKGAGGEAGKGEAGKGEAGKGEAGKGEAGKGGEEEGDASASSGLRLVFRDDKEAKYGVGAHKSAAVFGGVVLVACLGGVGYLAFRYWRMKRTVRSYQRALELMDQEDDL